LGFKFGNACFQMFSGPVQTYQPHLKSTVLTILELLAFNAQKLKRPRPFSKHF